MLLKIKKNFLKSKARLRQKNMQPYKQHSIRKMFGYGNVLTF